MVVGIGIGTEMALNGAAAHAFAHIIYKALLLMSAGSVLHDDRPAQVLRARRAVPHHAADDGLRHDRRAGDLGVPADLRLHLQVDDHRRPPPTAICRRVAAARRGFGRRVPARRHQVPVVRVLPEGFGPAPARAAGAACAGRWSCSRACASRIGVWPEPLYALLPYPVDYAPYTGGARRHAAAAAAVLRARLLRDAAATSSAR